MNRNELKLFFLSEIGRYWSWTNYCKNEREHYSFTWLLFKLDPVEVTNGEFIFFWVPNALCNFIDFSVVLFSMVSTIGTRPNFYVVKNAGLFNLQAVINSFPGSSLNSWNKYARRRLVDNLSSIALLSIDRDPAHHCNFTIHSKSDRLAVSQRILRNPRYRFHWILIWKIARKQTRFDQLANCSLAGACGDRNCFAWILFSLFIGIGRVAEFVWWVRRQYGPK